MSTLIIDFSRGFDHERQRGGTLRLGPIRDDRYLPPLGQAESRCADLILLRLSPLHHWLPGQLINFNRRVYI